MKRLLLWVMSLCLLLTTGMTAWGYSFNRGSPKWQGASTPIYVGIPGTSASGISWSKALTEAAQQWNDNTTFEFEVINEYRDPCARIGTDSKPDYLNATDFRNTVCGNRLSDTTIAVTVFFTEPNMLGSGDIVEADVIFNSNLAFDVYDGPQRAGEYDFRRVALHELGHVLGLAHDNDVAAIMNSTIGNRFKLQPDDINGANSLYSGLNNCSYTAIGFGWTFGDLETGDCLVQQLMTGGTDTSYVDVLMLDLAQPTNISMDMQTDGLLDSVLFLATDKLAFISTDEKSGGNCRPRIQADLPAGRYAILVNTYSGQPPCAQTTTGPWRLALSYNSAELLLLPGKQSFQGGVSDARFFGGITVNGGQSYSNRVAPAQPFDVVGRIEIDPRHQGQPGYIVMAVILNGEILIKNLAGEFVAYQPERELVPVAERRILGAVEHINVLKQFRADSVGIDNASVDFLIGYGVDSNPTELYFHQQPINLLVE
jgi:hypothetical protein